MKGLCTKFVKYITIDISILKCETSRIYANRFILKDELGIIEIYTYIKTVTVSQLTYHEERRGEIEADEVDPQVDAQSESGDCCHRGREVAQKTEPRFAAHPVGHHARHDREQAHYDERAGEIRHDRLCVGLQLELEGPRGESRGANVLKHTSVLGFADNFQKSLLPSGAADSAN